MGMDWEMPMRRRSQLCLSIKDSVFMTPSRLIFEKWSSPDKYRSKGEFLNAYSKAPSNRLNSAQQLYLGLVAEVWKRPKCEYRASFICHVKLGSGLKKRMALSLSMARTQPMRAPPPQRQIFSFSFQYI